MNRYQMPDIFARTLNMEKFLEPVLVVAPQLFLPARNGADISLEKVARHLSSHAKFVDLIGSHTIRRYRNAEVESDLPFSNQLHGKTSAGLRTVIFRTHYYHERFNNKRIRRVVREQMPKERYGIVLASYLTTLSLLPPALAGQRYFVWTHNDEFKWFEDLKNSSRSLLGKMACQLSLKWLRRELPRLATEAVFVHVTETDWSGFERVVPGHRHLIVSVGTDIDPPAVANHMSKSDKVVVSFIGTLGVRMALDALQYFHRVFESSLRDAFGENLVLQVIGSNPAQAVRDLCEKHGWNLYANVSETELSQRLSQSTFTMLPFEYATGIKLKLIRSLGGGVPFLSTLASQPPNFLAPPGCCFSNNPHDWVAAIQRWREQPDVNLARKQLLAIADGFSWPVVVSKMANSIQELPL